MAKISRNRSNIRNRKTTLFGTLPEILSAEVLGPNTSLDVFNSAGINPNGWVLKVVFKNIQEPLLVKPSNIVLLIQDPGFTSTGTATTIGNNVQCVELLRTQFRSTSVKTTNISSKGHQITTLYFSLSDYIYSGTSILYFKFYSKFGQRMISKTFRSGFVTNSSTLSYPKPTFSWVSIPNRLVRTASLSVEGVAFHPDGIAAVKYQVYNAAGTTIADSTAYVTSTAKSVVATNANPIEVYKTTLTSASAAWTAITSSSWQSSLNSVTATVYPKRGDSSTVIETTAAYTPVPACRLYFLYDPNTVFKNYIAYVNVNAPVGQGVVSTVPATAALSPFPTIYAAFNALLAKRASEGVTVIDQCKIYLMDNNGAIATHHVTEQCQPINSNSDLSSATQVYSSILVDPAATGEVRLTCEYSNGVHGNLWSNLYIEGITIVATANSFGALAGVSTYITVSRVILNKCKIISDVNIDGSLTVSPSTYSTTKVLFKDYSIKYLYNCTFSGTNNLDLQYGVQGYTAAFQNCAIALMAGCVATSNYTFRSVNDTPYSIMGSILPGFSVGPCRNKDTAYGETLNRGDSGRIIYNNVLLEANITNSTVATTNTIPVYIIQNLFDYSAAKSIFGKTTNAVVVFGNNDMTTSDAVIINNTIVGGSLGINYASVSTKQNFFRKIYLYSNIFDSIEIRDDRYNANITCGPFNYNTSYGVGFSSNINLFGYSDRSTSSTQHNDNADVPRMGSAIPYNNKKLLSTSFSINEILGTFTLYSAAPSATSSTGGTYTPLMSNSSLYNTNNFYLKYDILGNTRQAIAGAYNAV